MKTFSTSVLMDVVKGSWVGRFFLGFLPSRVLEEKIWGKAAHEDAFLSLNQQFQSNKVH